jgi:SAM-dependent methyltransferase
MIENLLERVDKSSSIVEVGSNDGSFLEALWDRGFENIAGIEPAEDAQRASRERGIETIGAYFTEETVRDLEAAHGQCDLFITHQTLEHVSDIETFWRSMQAIVRPGGYVLIEVPNFGLALRTPNYSTVWEEHVNYFVPETLDRFLEDSGVRVIQSESAVFSGEALFSVGEFTGVPEEPSVGGCSQSLRESAHRYAAKWPEFKAAFADFLHTHRCENKQVAVYGGGCRSSSLINFAGLESEIDLIVDDQAEKQERFMPGPGSRFCRVRR